MRPEKLLRALRKSKDLRALSQKKEQEVLEAFNADLKRREQRKEGRA